MTQVPLENANESAMDGMLDVVEAAHLLGIGRTLAYELIRSGEWPTPVVRIGRLIRIPRRALLNFVSTGQPSGEFS
ncbi:MAG: helix-turn-helix domain-containing protein [Jatrophihabitantaceae bacterium]